MTLDHPIPARASELLISKICHDLVSPVGAVNNGIEFMQDMGAEGFNDGIGLIEHSAKQASIRLQLFRMAYGAGGSDPKVTGKMIYETFQAYIADGKSSLHWDLMNAIPDRDLPAGFLKTLLNMMIFTHESLPKGGMITVTMTETDTNGCMIVTGQGDMIKPKEDSIEALRGQLHIDALSPKSIHGFIARELASLFNLNITSDISDDRLTLTLAIPDSR